MSVPPTGVPVSSDTTLIARTPGSPGEAAQPLEGHLRGVAERAARFVEQFADPAWGTLVAFWHDLGKAAPDWQQFIRDIQAEADEASHEHQRRGPAHAVLGAIHAAKEGPSGWRRDVLSLVIAGHHQGMADVQDWRTALRDPSHLRRYELARAEYEARWPESMRALPISTPPHLSPPATKRAVELFARFLFSALVDADALDAEEHAAKTGDSEAGQAAAARSFEWPALPAYDAALDAFMARKQMLAPATTVNHLRRRVLEECLATSRRKPGAFSLTVPTGGGKTLSSLAFALRHAISNEQRRVVIAVPFTAIIDQTADVLRDAFRALGQEVLVEHHSGLEPHRESRAARVSTDNWDAPLVVTTQVQLFESLFSNRASKCRKLHNLVNAVIILDEVQSLPHGVLAPILDVLNELVSHYRTSVVLTTATQPSLHSRALGGTPFEGLAPAPTEIISRSLRDDLWRRLRRVEVQWPASMDAPVAPNPGEFWGALAAEMASLPQVLAIVHLKKDARDLYQALQHCSRDIFHLSAGMCPAHRREVLSEVRDRLVAGDPCRLVSTQVIEAGVDVDFAVVYRAMAGLESLAQSAGRCNREGKLSAPGLFHVFAAPTPPPRSLRLHLDIARSMLSSDGNLDLLSPATFPRYFDRVYAARDLDSHAVQPLRNQLRFKSAATAFQMIDEGGESLFVPWNDDARRLTGELRHSGPSRRLLRHLQPYAVSIYPQQRLALERQSAIESLNGYLILGEFEPNLFYSRNLGLLTEADSSVALVL